MLVAPVLLLLIIFLVLPIALMAVYTFFTFVTAGVEESTLTLANWHEFLTDSYYHGFLLKTLRVGAMTALLCGVLAAARYVTPQLVGSGRDALFGNLISDTIMGELNWPMGATLSIVLFVVLGFFAAIYTRYMGMSQIVQGLIG
ncbi:MAG: hypothetical protein EOS29_29005 [Mesorhizobium sp.]|nr:MAG: hypothetical protein EOS29_29005 [Mesorhizobium sp.]